MDTHCKALYPKIKIFPHPEAKMYKKAVFTLTSVLLLVLFSTSNAFAARGSHCPPGFTLEMFMDHEEHEHQHVGIAVDLNGDGWICMMPVTPGGTIHVHVDNNVP
jgi:hypothetical protein